MPGYVGSQRKDSVAALDPQVSKHFRCSAGKALDCACRKLSPEIADRI
jgi:hypothetical protein